MPWRMTYRYPSYASIFGYCRDDIASSTDSGWKWKVSLRTSASGIDGAARSTHRFTPAAGLSHARSMLVTCSVCPSWWTKIITMSCSVPHLDGERRLRSREPRDRDPVRRRADVAQADRVEEMHRCRVAAMLAADPDLQVGPRLAPALDADAHEIADALHVDRRARISLEDFLVLINLQELPDVVS